MSKTIYLNNLETFKNYLKEIKSSTKLFKPFYESCGADLKKILKVQIINSNWTINQICAILKPQKDEEIIFLTSKKRGEYVDINFGFIDYNKNYIQGDNRGGLHCCYSKKQFETIRKDADTKNIFLLFKKEDIKGNYYARSNGYGRIKEELQEINNNNRYEIKGITNGSYSNEHYISAADITRKEINKTEYIHFIPQRFCYSTDIKNAPKTKEEIFDKSGYYLIEKRKYLKEQANRMRAQKKLQEVQNMDFSKDIEKIEEEYKKVVQESTNKIQKMDAFSKELADATKKLHDFIAWQFGSFKNDKERILNKKYAAKEQIFQTLEYYNNKIKQYKEGK